MTNGNFVILYVDCPETSAKFYAQLLQRQPLETHPTFAMFRLDSGLMLGLWSKENVTPAVDAVSGGSELAFTLAQPQEVEEYYQRWLALGLPILQTPVQMCFGYTFVARDPDGHRLRVFSND